MKPRYLTKSKFKQALQCPTKLFYVGKYKEYADNSDKDEFLVALAKGGYQVGELAKLYYPGGHDIETLDYEEALLQTNELLAKDEVIIYEAAIKYGNLFIRVDILIKKGNVIKLIEVKSKSYRSVDEFYTTRGTRGIKSDWKPYLYDIAFQKYVASKAFPRYKIHGFLMLANKNVNASEDGLFKRFLIKETTDGRVSISTKNTENLGDELLSAENVDYAIDLIWNGKESIGTDQYSFSDYVHRLEEAYVKDQKILAGVSTECRSCQYKLDAQEQNGLKSGFHECWTDMTPLSHLDLEQPLVIDIWNSRKINSLLLEGIYLQKDVHPDSLGTLKPNPSKLGLQSLERQQLQVIKSRDNDHTLYIDKDGLKHEMHEVIFPLHMIDFETTKVPIPFHKGTRPYEEHAFQFSHHVIEKDGSIRHENQWINTVPGRFPNFAFIRALQQALSNDEGSIFRYSNHENTVLNKIRNQLSVSDETDGDQLIRFIDSITTRTEGKGKHRVESQGNRNMIDLCEWIIKYYFDPYTDGSNSLKAVLPSVLRRSKFLKEKYSKPIYGNEIPSHNFKDHTWLQKEDDKIVSPYKQLPKLWDQHDRDMVDRLINPSNDLEDGGAAMTAYNYMQFDEMSDTERKATISALYHYCELDTLAMVMLWEGLNDLVFK